MKRYITDPDYIDDDFDLILEPAEIYRTDEEGFDEAQLEQIEFAKECGLDDKELDLIAQPMHSPEEMAQMIDAILKWR